MRVLVLHGPNLNLLGTREPEIYGETTLAQIDAALGVLGSQLGVQIECRQSNHEGVLIDWVQEAGREFDALLVNFGALTHTSVALADALSAVALPCVEVHVSNIHAREEFRETSLTARTAIGVVTGFGAESYMLGLRGLVGSLESRHTQPS